MEVIFLRLALYWLYIQDVTEWMKLFNLLCPRPMKYCPGCNNNAFRENSFVVRHFLKKWPMSIYCTNTFTIWEYSDIFFFSCDRWRGHVGSYNIGKVHYLWGLVADSAEIVIIPVNHLFSHHFSEQNIQNRLKLLISLEGSSEKFHPPPMT